MNGCDDCRIRGYLSTSNGHFPSDCPTKKDLQRRAEHLALEDERGTMLASHITTRYGYGQMTRVEEIMAYARISGFRKIGVAFCITLEKEAEIFSEVLRDNGFEAASIICKNGALPREVLDEPYICAKKPGMKDTLCNPIGQALACNEAGTQLNVILGLCVGHDSLFIKYSEAPVTYLATKDRVTGHNALTPLYLHEGLFERIHHADLPEENWEPPR